MSVGIGECSECFKTDLKFVFIYILLRIRNLDCYWS
jgi:hypothetical protein